MKLFLYTLMSPSNTINKHLENELELDINFKDVADILRPTLKIKSDTVINQNYAYIPDLGRFYFINDRETFPNRIYTLKLEVDVLMTHKEDILNSIATISRSTYSNRYFDGGDYRAEVKNEHKIYHSDTPVEFEESTVLVTIGG